MASCCRPTGRRSRPGWTAGCSHPRACRARSRSPGWWLSKTLALDAAIAGFQEAFTWWRRPDLVSVAAVQGHAVGAGFQLALACDVRVVADDVQLAMREPSLGLVPDLVGTWPLVQAVGYSRALEICLSGRWVGADEAVAIGIALRQAAPGRPSVCRPSAA